MDNYNNIFILGSKGIPAKYGGFETFVQELVMRKKEKKINYFVTCLSNTNEIKKINDITCFHLKIPKCGGATAVLYDLLSLNYVLKYIKKNKVKNAKIYILACRIGPFLHYFKKEIERNRIELLINPDGNEWKRSKWSLPVRVYWKLSERFMVKHADGVICDSKAIQKYIETEYSRYKPKTEYISYGAESIPSNLRMSDPKPAKWFKKYNITPNEYYLIVGRFVPENNYELIINEFMKSNTKKDLIIVTNIEENNFKNHLLKKTRYEIDPRIKFVGTVYDSELLKLIREHAFAYIHGHSVGGTNPSLLEALASSKLSLLYDVSFNREVAEDSALYFSDFNPSLSKTIGKIENYSDHMINEFDKKSSNIITSNYSWNKIVKDYELRFSNEL
ncbi:beta 1-4 rhamnosyltransferase Cps2T [Exiguobacterium alkaliphilum]|uniref:beta 1-4 rhamnosyltransferase Cps2T n=1 Tax=Exiguobacterium alkaliphilum TaxID=1428684 RepID=UPI0005537B50|nr:DUF1972 domain-containing protein [Exiguobacterium alkaliphilum]